MEDFVSVSKHGCTDFISCYGCTSFPLYNSSSLVSLRHQLSACLSIIGLPTKLQGHYLTTCTPMPTVLHIRYFVSMALYDLMLTLLSVSERHFRSYSFE